MTAQEILSAAAIFKKISEWQYVVSKERFGRVAMTKFGIAEKDIDMLYGLFGTARSNIVYVNSEYDRYHITENMPLAIQIAEETYNIYHNNLSIPGIPSDRYYERDKRRYYVSDTSVQPAKHFSVDVNLRERAEIISFAELLQRDGIEVREVTHVLGQLEHKRNSKEDKMDYYEGDVVFVFGNPTDSMWRSWYREEESGVFIATDHGWAKLLYTPGRGYVNKKHEVEFESEERWNEHKIQGIADGKEWRYVGNIHDDISILVDKGDEESE
jgi:hypothetical protein